MERELPTINLNGTDFIVDVEKLELREKADPTHIITLDDMQDVGNGYVYDGIKIPEFLEIDPEGMSAKYNVSDLTGKTDFDLIVDQEAFYNRFAKGIRPTVDIAGHIFHVYIEMDMLRSHDDFASRGIVFDEIENYFVEEENVYIIPYNPQTHEFQELEEDDYEITEFPKDLIAVQFPFQTVLDPIGWNIMGGWDIEDNLKWIGVKSHFEAKVIPWEETWVQYLIDENLSRQNKQEHNQKPEVTSILPEEPHSPEERELPTINLDGTEFIVDVNNLELREKAEPIYVIALEDMLDIGGGYRYDNFNIPEFVKMDPEGMATKYNTSDLTGKTDFDLIVGQEAFDERVNKGMLPTVDIAGHIFYVDLMMDMLRPHPHHNDLHSNGIEFDEIENYFSEELRPFIVPYNPKTHEFQEVDYDKITEFPKDLIAVQFPLQEALDSTGRNKMAGFKNNLKRIGLQPHFQAAIIPWEKTGLVAVIKDNLERQNKQEEKKKPMVTPVPPKEQKRKGRKM